jgi:hypothetical protein
MILNSILDKRMEDLGLYLEEDEDFVYLKHEGEILEVFNAHSADKQEIVRVAASWVAVYCRKNGKVQRSFSTE